MRKYNLSEIMTRAWMNYRKLGISFSESLHRSWITAKAADENRIRIESAKSAAGITEETATWYDWKKAGYEVKHGSKALFQVVLIWGAKGDGATYKGSFFGRSQVEAVA